METPIESMEIHMKDGRIYRLDVSAIKELEISKYSDPPHMEFKMTVLIDKFTTTMDVPVQGVEYSYLEVDGQPRLISGDT